ncbi:MAG TPA: hypothetical protein DIW64_18900 [Cellvibrio sp.]|nr:hypothetical protein [Cellvibrio sp.]
MAISEEKYDEITDELDAHDFFLLGDLARAASNSNLFRELDHLHSLAKSALDYAYSETTHDELEAFYEEVDEIRSRVMDSIEALEKIDDVLSNAEEVLSNALYADEFDGE